MVTGQGKDPELAIHVHQWPQSSGTCPCWPHAARSVHDLLEVRKAKAPHFLYLKGSKGSSEGILRHFMTPWRSWSRMPLHEAGRSLDKSPFCLWDSVPCLPNGKNQHVPFSQGLLEFYIEEHEVSRHCGGGNHVSTQPEVETQSKAFSNRNNPSHFCHLQLQSSIILSAWEVEKHSSCPIQIHANSRQNFGLLN